MPIANPGRRLMRSVGLEFDVLVVSIDPKDTPETATKKRAQVVGSYAGLITVPAVAGCTGGVLLGNALSVPLLSRTATVTIH